MQIKVIDMKISKKWQLNADGSQTSAIAEISDAPSIET